MDYKDVRTQFVKLSGRYDLINANYTDNGADVFINEGQKLLDRMFSAGPALARYPYSIASGTYKLYTTGLRAVKEVWVTDSDGYKTELTRESFNSLRHGDEEELSQVTTGTPEYYAPGIFRPYPDTLASATVATWDDVEDLILGTTWFTYDGIIFTPPADDTYTMTIVGLFYSPTLSATLAGETWTQVKSYWTEVHPMTLVKAALVALESFYRTGVGLKNRMDSLMLDVTGLDHDLVEKDIAGASLQMGG
jgi:hypothetical protein